MCRAALYRSDALPQDGGRRRRPGLSGQSGVALFMVIWILALLMVIVGEFGYSMRTEVNATRQFKEAAQAYYIAEAGLSRAIVEVLKQSTVSGEADDAAAPLSEEGSEAPWRVNVPLPTVAFGEGQYRVYIDNESGRVNINTAERGLLQMLVDHFDLSETEKDTIVDAILDWRDSDELHRLNGAESDYYQSLSRPYHSKNGPFDTVSELLLVRGVTPEIYYNGLQDMVTVALDDGSGTSRRFTRANTLRRAAAGGAVNINAARPAMLAALPDMTADAVQDVLAFRAHDDFRSLDEVAAVVGGEIFEAIAPFITLQMSPYYIIHTEGRLAGSPVRQLVSTRVRIDPDGETKFVVLERRMI
jgi:general secretion pathway protein K